jgi:acyl-CoA thioesterase-1
VEHGRIPDLVPFGPHSFIYLALPACNRNGASLRPHLVRWLRIPQMHASATGCPWNWRRPQPWILEAIARARILIGGMIALKCTPRSCLSENAVAASTGARHQRTSSMGAELIACDSLAGATLQIGVSPDNQTLSGPFGRPSAFTARAGNVFNLLMQWITKMRCGCSSRSLWPAARIGCIAVALLSAAPGVTLAQESTKSSPAETCLKVNRNLSLGASLPRTAATLKAGHHLTIVVIGSSSTVGLWVLNKAETYPEVMRRELSRLQGKSTIQVINSGRIGDTVPGIAGRLQHDVLSHTPDLVVVQLGTNDILWGGRMAGLKKQISRMVRVLRTNGSDVILMDVQYAPVTLASSRHLEMQKIIFEVTREEKVGFFSRFDLMRRAVEAGVPRHALVSFDMLHNSAQGYDCIGRALARAIHTAVRFPKSTPAR